MKKKQPEVRHPLYLCAQTLPHVPGPSGQVLLQSFNQVPQNASDPAANAGLVVRTPKIVVANKIRMPVSRMAFPSRDGLGERFRAPLPPPTHQAHEAKAGTEEGERRRERRGGDGQ